MGASLLYADFYHMTLGNNFFVKATLVIFTIMSVVFFFLVLVMEVLDLVSLPNVTMAEVQDSLINVALFDVPVLHCVVLGYIWWRRREMGKRGGDSYSEAQNALNPNGKYAQQVDDNEAPKSSKRTK